MKKSSLVFTLLLAVWLAPAQPAFGWGSATHAYIGHELRAQAGPVDLDEVYGDMAPDLFNFLFTTAYAPLYPYLYGVSHGDGAEVRAALSRGWEEGVLYGFLGHNDIWGADFTAHHASLTLEPDAGYVITKALALRQVLAQVPEYAALGLTDAASLEVCHNLVESAGDLIVAGAEPRVGAWMAASAERPAEALQGLLTRAWTAGLVENAASFDIALSPEEAAGVILASEASFRARIVTLGEQLQQDPIDAFEAAVLDFAALAEAYLASLGVTLPPGADLTPLIGFALAEAMTVCSEDYVAETQATIDATRWELRRQGALKRVR